MIHELRITNQVMYLNPPLEEARFHITQELFSWQAVITTLPRIQHSRYQVSHTSSTHNIRSVRHPALMISGQCHASSTHDIRSVSQYQVSVTHPALMISGQCHASSTHDIRSVTHPALTISGQFHDIRSVS